MQWIQELVGVIILITFPVNTKESLPELQFLESGPITNDNSTLCSKVECEPISCDDGTLLTNKAGPWSCCSACVQFAKINENCIGHYIDSMELNSWNRSISMPDICGPKLICNTNGVCTNAKYDPHCLKRLQDYNSGKKTSWKPDCDEEGRYQPKQCKANKCFCRDPDNQGLFGKANLLGNNDATDMNCACSLVDDELLKQGLTKGVFDHVVCENNGNYLPLQCLRGLCFCVNATSGEIDGVVVPMELMTRLPCYDANDYSKLYERPCQKQRLYEENLADYYANKGYDPSLMSTIQCEASGGHKGKQCENGKCYCADTDGKKLDLSGYVDVRDNKRAAGMNCYCARDAKEALLSGGTSSNFQCEDATTGNYNPRQCSNNNVCYCADMDGDKISLKTVPANPTDEQCQTIADKDKF